MSGDEHTNNDPAHFSEINQSSVGCTDSGVEPSDNKTLCAFDGVKSESRSFFDSSQERIPAYQDTLVGDIINWDVGKCFDEGLNPGQTFGEVFDIFDTSFQGGEQPEMGNNFGNKYAARQPDHGGVVSEEQLPEFGVESMGCEPVEYGGEGAHLNEKIPEISLGATGTEVDVPHCDSFLDTINDGDKVSNCIDEMTVGDGSKWTHPNEKIPGNSFGAIGAEVEVPHCNSPHDTKNDGDKVSNCSNEMAGEQSLSPQEVENKILEPVEVGSWESINEVAKQSVEIVACIPTTCDQDMLSHESESEIGEPSGVLNGVECVKSDLVSASLNPEDNVVALSSQLHFQKQGPVEDSSKNDDGKDDGLHEPIHASKVLLDSTYLESTMGGIRFADASENQEEGIPSRVHLKQKENATSEGEQDNACKEQTCMAEQVGKSHHDTGKQSGGLVKGTSAACDEKASLNEQSRQSLQEVGKKGHAVVLGLPATDSTVKAHRSRTPVKANEVSEKSRRGRRPSTASATPVNRNLRQPAAANSRVLRSKSREDPITPEPIAILENTQGSSVGRRGRKKREFKGKSDDEFSKMRKRLRYLLHRIGYEQNLLDAYSSEGWRGQSLEKLRPEKELQRAKADINRSKVKIRELFHRLESMSAEGKYPDSLYDSEGLIDSEDIYCAKCGSKDLHAGNDIILCDGNCDRGFHQYCLEPPLRTEEIPPGDEGWFCPACDCKFDCIDLLNDSQGAKLSIEDSWEKVFPEALAAMTALKQDDIAGLPSDDSEDNDYNPDGQDDGSKDERKEPGSNESNSDDSDSSDFSSASEDLGAVCKDEQYLGLLSDDSEDDDFDPDVANASNDGDDCASSNSDFTSASEDLGATVGNDEMSKDLEDKHSIRVELDQNLDDSSSLSGKRHVERLDYKKLFDETYGNAVSDSSDDDEWTDDVATVRRKTSAKRVDSVDGASPAVTPRRRGRSSHDHQVEIGLPVEVQKTPQETSSSGKSTKRPPYSKLPESVTQRLYESLKENQYPDRSTKEKLAEELGLTPAKVDKWFGNARWSFRHHPSRAKAGIAQVLPERGDADSSKKLDKGSDENISTPRKTRKRKEEDDELQTSKIDTSKESGTQANSSQTPGFHGRVQRKRRKSGA